MSSSLRRLFVAAALSGMSVVLAGVLVPGRVEVRAAQAAGGSQWVTAWSTSQHSLGRTAVSNATVRLIAPVAVSGDAVRVRLDNTFGTTPLMIGTAGVALRMRGALLAAMTARPLLFGGSPSVTIPPGGTVVSDPVTIKVVARQDLAISLFVPGADVRPSEHGMALMTSYATANGAGDLTADEAAAKFTTTMTSMPWLKSIDVMAPPTAAAVVTFGDSITDGFCSTVDGHDTWGDWLSLRLDLDGKRQIAVLNEGINGNTLTAFPTGAGSTPGVERLDRDVLSHSGVTHVVLFLGTNDIRRGPPASQVIGGMENVIQRVKAKGLRIYGVTIIPRHISGAGQPGNPGWTAEANKVRDEVNGWMRNKAQFDAVIDFDKVVKDPANPEYILAPFNCDGIHLTPRGYYEAARSIRLDLFDRPKSSRR